MRIPWWLCAVLGGALLAGADHVRAAAGALRLAGRLLLACALVRLLLLSLARLSPAAPDPAPDAPPLPVQPARKKYSERDFMPPELRDRPPESPPPGGRDAGDAS